MVILLKERADLLSVFGSRMKALEILSLLKGFKAVARQGFYDAELPRVEGFGHEYNLFLVRSRFRVNLQDSNQGFSNKGLSTSAKDPRGMFFVYIGKDEVQVHRAALYELRGDHFRLGRILGFPECCGRFFSEQEPLRSKLDNNYEVPVLENSQGDSYSFLMNIFRRNEDACILSHFPCSLSCKKSQKWAEQLWTLLQQYDPAWAAGWKRRLSGKVRVYGRLLNFI